MAADVCYVIETENDYINRLSGAVLNNALYVEMNDEMKDERNTKENIEKLGYEVEEIQVKVSNLETSTLKIPCTFISGNVVGKWKHTGSGVTNVDGTALALIYQIPLPTNKAGLALYIGNIYAYLSAADASNYASRVRIIAKKNDGTVQVIYDANPPSLAWTSTGYKTISNTADDVSAYESIEVWINLVVATGGNFVINYVGVDTYYG